MNSKTNILVVGAHFYNKGAHLMMKTVLDHFRDKPDYKLYLSPLAGSREQIEELGYSLLDYPLKHVTAYRSFGIFFTWGNLLKYLRSNYRGTLPIDKVDVVLDISGFAFSDQWGQQAVINVNKLVKFFKNKEAKYIFLPQAFGPFSGTRMRREMKEVINNADMVIARDRDSAKMLTELNPEMNTRQYPDITISLKPQSSELDIANYTCIVPNERMLDQGREFWPEGKYLSYLKRAIDKLLSDTNQTVILLVHDKGTGDTNLAKSLKEDYQEQNRVIVLYEEDPVKLKAILGTANAVIGSRFHALVSALSQDVPSMAFGWSHKYETLFNEYKIDELAFSKPDDLLFDKSIKNILELEENSPLKIKIREANKQLKEKNRQMWTEVETIISAN